MPWLSLDLFAEDSVCGSGWLAGWLVGSLFFAVCVIHSKRVGKRKKKDPRRKRRKIGVRDIVPPIDNQRTEQKTTLSLFYSRARGKEKLQNCVRAQKRGGAPIFQSADQIFSTNIVHLTLFMLCNL